MSIFRFIQNILSPLLFLNMFRQFKGRTSLMKIKAARMYVQGVEKTRILCVGLFLLMCSLILLVSGLVLLHIGIFAYSPWSFETKLIMALVLGVVELFIAGSLLIYLFKEETWARFAEISKVMECAMEDDLKPKSGKEDKDEIKTNEKECEQGTDLYAMAKHSRF